MVRGSKGKRSGTLARLQPLNLIKFSFNENSNKELVYLREPELEIPYTSIHQRVDKSSIVLFLAEVLYKAIREETKNITLYSYIKNSLLYLDQSASCTNFHLVFLIKLSTFIGYMPSLSKSKDQQFFDIQEGNLTSNEPLHQYYFSEQNSALMHSLSGMNFDDCEQLKIAKKVRFNFLCDLLNYYRFHMEGMGEIKSHEVLQTVLE